MMTGWRSGAVAIFGVLGILSFAAVVYWTFTQAMNPDEMEHLHATYLLLEGRVPYRDFWQNHTPTLWFVFAPIMAAWPVDASICYVARGVGLLGSLLVFLTAVRVSVELCEGKGSGSRDESREMGSESMSAEFPDAAAQRTAERRSLLLRNAAVIAAVYWGTAIMAEAPIFRTDVWMTWFVLLSALAALRAERAGARRQLWWCFAAGAAFGVSLCFSTKLFPLVIALPLALLLRRGSVGGSINISIGRWIVSCAAYSAGIALAILPLGLYLRISGADSGFYRWVVVFNRMRSGSAHGFETWWMPTILAALAVVALLAIGTRRVGGGNFWTPRWMLLLALACAIFLYPLEARVFAYYIAPVIALGAPFLLAETWAMRWPTARSRIVSASIVTALFLAGSIPAGMHLWATRRPEHQLRKNLEFIQWMVDAAQGRVVHCNVPAHPIYVFDLTPFYIPWQLHYLAQTGTPRSAMLHEYLRDAPPFADQFESQKPVILHILPLRSYLSMLQQEGLIDQPGLDRVRRILVEEYREVNDTFYVRRSR